MSLNWDNKSKEGRKEDDLTRYDLHTKAAAPGHAPNAVFVTHIAGSMSGTGVAHGSIETRCTTACCCELERSRPALSTRQPKSLAW